MPKPLTKFERRSKPLPRQLTLPETQVRHATKVKTVRLSPRILTIWLFRAVKRLASILQGLVRIARRN
jgi:hypothetical protein